MIIKLLPVKSVCAIGSTLGYIARDKGKVSDYRKQAVFHNVLNSVDLKQLTQEFESNYKNYAKQRIGGNTALHAILSISPLDREKMNLTVMDDIVRKYLERAYPHAMAVAVHHVTELHFHSHALISSNEIKNSKSTRISKQELKEIHLDMLEYVRQVHQLETTIDMKNWGKQLHNEKEYYKQKRNPDLKLSKVELQEKIQNAFRQSESSQNFYSKLKEELGLTTYDYKGSHHGVYWDDCGTQKKMRFSRLGIEKEQIQDLDKQNALINERLKELEDITQVQQLSLEIEAEHELGGAGGTPCQDLR